MMASSKSDDAPHLELGLPFKEDESPLETGTILDRAIDAVFPSSVDVSSEDDGKLNTQVKKIEDRVNHVESKVNAVHDKVEEITSGPNISIAVPSRSASPTHDETESSFKPTSDSSEPVTTVEALTAELAEFL